MDRMTHRGQFRGRLTRTGLGDCDLETIKPHAIGRGGNVCCHACSEYMLRHDAELVLDHLKCANGPPKLFSLIGVIQSSSEHGVESAYYLDSEHECLHQARIDRAAH